MAEAADADSGKRPGSGEIPDNGLFALYEEYLGEPEEKTDVYLGFTLFIGGILGAVAGLGLFMVANGKPPDSESYFRWAKPAFALGMLALPTTVSGIVVLLPIDRRAVYATLAGFVITVIATGGFWTAYPSDWAGFGSNETLPIVGLYALGLTIVVGSTGAALIADQIARMKVPGPADIQPVEDEEGGEDISDEQIRSDIDEAMEGVNLSWGGVEKHEGSSLSFSADDLEGQKLDANLGTKVTRSSGTTDSAVSGLKGLKGGENKTAKSESTVDDQTAALNQLKQERKEEEERREAAGAGGGSSGGLVGKVKSLIGL